MQQTNLRVRRAAPDRVPTGGRPARLVAVTQKTSDTQGGFTGTLHDGERFARAVASLGDHDGDGVGDLDGDGDTDLADLGILLADFGCAP